MADIRVKPTKRFPGWAWVLVVLLLVAVAATLYVSLYLR